MKKILLLLLVILLTGCDFSKDNDDIKKSCNFTFNGNMTEDYFKDSKNCSVVNYVDEINKVKVITTPTTDYKRFTAKIIYNGYDVWNSFSDVEFINMKVRNEKNKNLILIELYTDKKMANVHLILLDIDGNFRMEHASISSPTLEGDNLIINKYLRVDDSGEFLCKNYDGKMPAYREIIYDSFTLKQVKTRDVLIKDVCN